MNGSASLAQGVRETAAALGMNPMDLATIISYETGGTFDPTKRGPTTQWGQHRGLIQFGEPQARQYGVDWNNPAASQLGADGAIVRYFRQNGWKPGMGMLDAYSIVNAGGPGLYNRSDANNGGAPGTVADKVRDQMGGHRQNALRLLGSDEQATTNTQGAVPMMQQEEKPRGLLGSLGIQKMEEGAAGETGQRFFQRDSFKDTAAILAQGFGRLGIMGMEEIADDIAKQRTENKARNKTIEYLRKSGRDDLADAVGSGALGARDAAGILFSKPKAGEIREINNTLVRVMPDGTVNELYKAGSPEELTADMREYKLAQEQGFEGNFIEFIQAQKGGGLQIRTNPDGTTEIIQGGPSGVKLTEGQSKATGFYARSDEANKLLSNLEQEGTQMRNFLSGSLPFGNYVRTAEGQQYEQAKRNFINAILRQESGAAIGQNEFASADLQYFPQPGDGPEVIAQKRAARETAVNALKVAAGPGAGALEQPASTAGGGATDDPLGLRE